MNNMVKMDSTSNFKFTKLTIKSYILVEIFTPSLTTTQTARHQIKKKLKIINPHHTINTFQSFQFIQPNNKSNQPYQNRTSNHITFVDRNKQPQFSIPNLNILTLLCFFLLRFRYNEIEQQHYVVDRGCRLSCPYTTSVLVDRAQHDRHRRYLLSLSKGFIGIQVQYSLCLPHRKLDHHRDSGAIYQVSGEVNSSKES